MPNDLTMGKNRSSVLIAIGVAVFVVGSGLAFLAVHSGGGDNNNKVQTAATTPAAATPGQVTAAGAATPSFSIPTGKQAVAVQVPYIQGVAGFVKAGDKVNLFGTVKNGPLPKALAAPGPAVKLIVPNVEVLSVAAPAAVAGAAAASTFILALNAVDAEQVVYFQSFEGLYMTLARSDQGVLTTPGRSAGNPL
jgi:Flp pilus assembly protein CpaB